MEKILVIGACGQLGTDLTVELRRKFGKDHVIASDLNAPSFIKDFEPFVPLDVTQKDQVISVVKKHKITQIYNLASILSANAEQNAKLAWDVNVNGLMNVLELAREKLIQRLFWPSSIAVFGPDTPSENTPQTTIMNPKTVYGISKLTGERWCEYYHDKFGVDVRSLRFPGLVGYNAPPGGGTTDYAVDIYHQALETGSYESYLAEDTSLPFMYMSDAIKATMQLMETDSDRIKIRSSYNVNAFSISPREIAASIKEHISKFTITYRPDYRQEIAGNWPHSINDTVARKDWGWDPDFGLKEMTRDMLEKLAKSAAKK
ncbi:MAG: NAD-dependent epimerase/dehydratase family protein [Balneolales bacterium]